MPPPTLNYEEPDMQSFAVTNYDTLIRDALNLMEEVR